jgi:hypothetical protein
MNPKTFKNLELEVLRFLKFSKTGTEGTALVSILRGRANKPNFHAHQCNWRQGKSNVEGGGDVPQIVS